MDGTGPATINSRHQQAQRAPQQAPEDTCETPLVASGLPGEGSWQLSHGPSYLWFGHGQDLKQGPSRGL